MNDSANNGGRESGGARSGWLTASGCLGLFQKELERFLRVWAQTVMAPVLSTLLYMLIFSHILRGRVEVFEGVDYTTFLLPGLIMMTVLQNSFANSASSLIQSKVTGNIVTLLLPPITPPAFFAAYVGAAMVRGIAVGAGVLVAGALIVPAQIQAFGWLLFFILSGSAMAAALGVIAGLWAEKFDQIALFQNFVIMPLTFLSGVFYSIESLPPLWRALSQWNPFLYMVDGFRYGFFAQSDTGVATAAACTLAATAACCAGAYYLLAAGYKLRN